MLKIPNNPLFTTAITVSIVVHAGLALLWVSKAPVSNAIGTDTVEVMGYAEEPKAAHPHAHRHDGRQKSKLIVKVTPSKENGELEAKVVEERIPSSSPQTKGELAGTGVVYSEGEVDKPARLKSTPRLRYPANQLADGNEADVELYLVLDPQGRVIEKEVSRSAGREFDEAALAAAQTLSFEPATKEGQPVSVHVHWTCRFRIQ